MVERQVLESLRLGPFLWIDKLQLISVYEHQIRARLRADTNPVDALWWKHRAVGFDRDLEAALVERGDQTFIELQQRFSARADDETSVIAVSAPATRDCVGQVVCAGKTPAVIANPDEVGIAKAADGSRAIGLAARPEIATSETTKYCRAARMKAFALEREEDLFDSVVRHTAPGLARQWRQTPRVAGDKHRIARNLRQMATDHSSSTSCRSLRRDANQVR